MKLKKLQSTDYLDRKAEFLKKKVGMAKSMNAKLKAFMLKKA